MVIVGNSKDETVNIASSHGATVHIEPKRGYGRAYKTGFDIAKGDVIVTLDADGTYPSSMIPYLLSYFPEYDFITTNRLHSPDKNAMSPRNLFGNLILSFTAELLFDFPFFDSQSGMWMFKKKVWKRIRKKVKSNGMAFSQEFKVDAFRKFKSHEINIAYRKRKGEVKLDAWGDGIGNLIHLFQKRWDW